MTIETLLKENLDVRLTLGDRWLCWGGYQWVVITNDSKLNKLVLYLGRDLDKALEVLVRDQGTGGEDEGNA